MHAIRIMIQPNIPGDSTFESSHATSRKSYTRRLKTMKNGGSTQECINILRCFLSGFTGNFTKHDVQKTESKNYSALFT